MVQGRLVAGLLAAAEAKLRVVLLEARPHLGGSFDYRASDYDDDQKLFVTGVAVANSTDGGRSWYDIDWPPRRLFAGISTCRVSVWLTTTR